MKRERLAGLSAEQKQRFLPLCPDFVIELRSSSDRLVTLQDKMTEYIENGAKLGWLIDPVERKAHVYRPDEELLTLDKPASLDGESVLRGFTLELEKIWKPGL